MSLQERQQTITVPSRQVQDCGLRPGDAPAPRFSLIIPCYNEEAGILSTIQEIRGSLQGAEPYELIIVNDGSTDGTSARLDEAQREDSSLRVVSHSRNQGYGAALKTGIRRAASDLLVITDADGTYPNHRIPELVQIAAEADMVVGARTAEDVQYPLIRKIPKVFLRLYANWLAGQEIPDLNSGMRVFRRSVVERFFHILPDGFSFTTTITLAMLTNRYDVRYVPIGYSSRIGKSKIKPVRDTINFFQLIMRTGMYFAPLRVFAPFLWLTLVAFSISLGFDVLVLRDLTEKTLILLMFFINSAMFALLADMIDKRSGMP